MEQAVQSNTGIGQTMAFPRNVDGYGMRSLQTQTSAINRLIQQPLIVLPLVAAVRQIQ